MRSVQIKNVPDDVHAELRRRAGAAGTSLQEYLLALLREATNQPPLDEVLNAAGGRSGGSASFDDVVAFIRADRDTG